ncbi:MAG: response regulator transcription factor [Candidatus Competibacterales bacterium]
MKLDNKDTYDHKDTHDHADDTHHRDLGAPLGERSLPLGTTLEPLGSSSVEVLVVEDDANMVFALEYALSQAGFAVRCACSGDQALAAMAERCPALVLLDVVLPDRSGFDLCQTIRADPKWCQTKVVMVTAKARAVEREKGLALGADAYLTKPFTLTQLLVEVNAQLAIAA